MPYKATSSSLCRMHLLIREFTSSVIWKKSGTFSIRQQFFLSVMRQHITPNVHLGIFLGVKRRLPCCWIGLSEAAQGSGLVLLILPNFIRPLFLGYLKIYRFGAWFFISLSCLFDSISGTKCKCWTLFEYAQLPGYMTGFTNSVSAAWFFTICT
jgi:hypothetical protein